MKKDIRPHLYFKEYKPEQLQNERIKLNLTQKEVGNAIGVTPVAISAIETGKTSSPWIIQLYGIVLERYKAYCEGYIPTYRKEGTTVQNEICGLTAVIKDF